MTKNMKRFAPVALALALSAFALAGCTTVATGSATSLSPIGDGLRIVGGQNGTYQYRQVANETGADITAIAVRTYGADYSENLLADGAWADGELVELCYPFSGTLLYDVKLTAGGRDYEIPAVRWGDITNVVHEDEGTVSPVNIKIDGDEAYLEHEWQGEMIRALAM